MIRANSKRSNSSTVFPLKMQYEVLPKENKSLISPGRDLFLQYFIQQTINFRLIVANSLGKNRPA